MPPGQKTLYSCGLHNWHDTEPCRDCRRKPLRLPAPERPVVRVEGITDLGHAIFAWALPDESGWRCVPPLRDAFIAGWYAGRQTPAAAAPCAHCHGSGVEP